MENSNKYTPASALSSVQAASHRLQALVDQCNNLRNKSLQLAENLERTPDHETVHGHHHTVAFRFTEGLFQELNELVNAAKRDIQNSLVARELEKVATAEMGVRVEIESLQNVAAPIHEAAVPMVTTIEAMEKAATLEMSGCAEIESRHDLVTAPIHEADVTMVTTIGTMEKVVEEPLSTSERNEMRDNIAQGVIPNTLQPAVENESDVPSAVDGAIVEKSLEPMEIDDVFSAEKTIELAGTPSEMRDISVPAVIPTSLQPANENGIDVQSAVDGATVQESVEPCEIEDRQNQSIEATNTTSEERNQETMTTEKTEKPSESSIQNVEKTAESTGTPSVSLQSNQIATDGEPTVEEPKETPSKSEDTIVIRNELEFLMLCNSYFRGGHTFIKIFEKYQNMFFKNADTEVQYHDDGHNYEQKIKAFDKIQLFKKKNGLGLQTPLINFENLDRLCAIASQKLSFLDSANGSKIVKMTIKEFIAAMKNSDNSMILNLLSFEFSKNEALTQQFQVPDYLTKHSIVEQLRELVDKEIKELKSKPGKAGSSKINQKAIADLEKMRAELPELTKFLLLSMKGSFTDLHIDFSATSVYYHVLVGKKIFYVAKPTVENVEMYAEWEKNGHTTEWIVQKLSGQFRRLEICAGETAMLPAGYLHFVYTAEHSIVVGGNFLAVKDLELHFKVTKLEKQAKTVKTERFDKFYQIIFAYLDKALIPELRGSLCERNWSQIAEILKRELDEHHLEDKQGWYSKAKRTAVMNTFMGLVEGNRKRSAESSVDGPPAKRQLVETEEKADENTPKKPLEDTGKSTEKEAVQTQKDTVQQNQVEQLEEEPDTENMETAENTHSENTPAANL